jgi:maleylpyruvate isomerase
MPEHLRGGEAALRPDLTLGWWADGEHCLAAALGRLDDTDVPGPSLLPGWSRIQVLGHVARNADALVNLLTWARTGVQTPMYASPEARAAGIADAARLSAPELRAEVLAAAGRLVAAVADMPDAAWSTEVRTAQDRTVPASEVPWMRCREAWVHAVDLDAGITFADVPEDVQVALLGDVFGTWDRRGELPDVVVSAGERHWGRGSLAVAGPLSCLTAWVTGRSAGNGHDVGNGLSVDGPLPALPAWL